MTATNLHVALVSQNVERCLFIEEVKIHLVSKEFRIKSSVIIVTRRYTKRKSSYFKGRNFFRWRLEPPCEVMNGTTFTVLWKPEIFSKPIVIATISQNNFAQGTFNGEVVYKHPNCRVTATYRASKTDGALETALHASVDPRNTERVHVTHLVHHAVNAAASRKSLLNRLGRSIDVLKSIMTVGEIIGSLHPPVRALVECFSSVVGLLERQDADNKDVLGLITRMSDSIEYVFDVEQFAMLVQLKNVVEELKILIQETADFIILRGRQSCSAEAVSVILSRDREVIKGLQSRFTRFKEKFDRGVLVQGALTTDDLKVTLKKLVSSQDDDKYLDRLDPRHETRALRCLEGTRTGVLVQIKDWARDLEADNVLLVHGYPGVGKSTIVSHAAKDFRCDQRLGAIFAFHRGCGNGALVVWRNVSYEIAYEYPICREIILSKLKNGVVRLTNATINEVFQHLVLEPLTKLVESGTVPHDRFPVIVIDALDECGTGRKEILAHITQWTKLPKPLKLLVTSRFEQDIQLIFSKIPHQAIEVEAGATAASESTHDIQLFLKHRFKEIKEFSGRSLSEDWPGEEIVNNLAKRAEGIFIWAVTALDYVEEFDPEQGLEDLQSGSLPAGNVHALYRQLLENSFPRSTSVSSFRILISAVVAAQAPLSAADFAHLLDMKESTVESICGKLRSVLDEGVARFRHRSFVDFLTLGDDGITRDSLEDKAVCPEHFRINVEEGHQLLAEASFRLMNKELRFNICNIRSSFLPNDTLQLNDSIKPSLAYVSQFWALHLEHVPLLADWSAVISFVQDNLLSWLEVLSIRRVLDTGAPSLSILEQLMSSNQALAETSALVRDAIKFVKFFAPAIAQNASHIYLSALPFAPKSSKIARVYAPRFRNTIRLQLGRLENWPNEELVVNTGHTNVISSTAISNDGRLIVSASYDNTLQVWDGETGSLVACGSEEHEDAIWCVAFSPDCKYVATWSRDKTVRLWVAKTGQAVGEPFRGHTTRVCSVTFSLDGKYIASGSYDGTVWVREVGTGRMVAGPFTGHESYIVSLAFVPGERQVISCSAQSIIRVWDIGSGEMIASPTKLRDSLTKSATFSSDVTRTVLLSDDTIQTFDLKTGEVLSGPFRNPDTQIHSFAISSDNKHIVLGLGDGTIRILDAETGEETFRSFYGHLYAVTAIVFLPDGKRVVSGSADTSLRIWDVKECFPGVSFNGRRNGITFIALSHDGRRLASCSSDSTISVRDVSSTQILAGPFVGNGVPVSHIAWSHNDKHIVSGSLDGTISIWDSGTGELAAGPFRENDAAIISVTFLPTSKQVISCSEDKTIRTWDVEKGQVIARSEVSSFGVAFSPDKKFMAVYTVHSDRDRSIEFIDTESGKLVTKTPVHTTVTSMAFSCTSDCVVVGYYDGTVNVLDMKSGQAQSEPFVGHMGYVSTVAFSPDNKYVVSGSDDTTVRVWKVENYNLSLGLVSRGHMGTITSFAFSHDGKTLFSSSVDGNIRSWDMTDPCSMPTMDRAVLNADGWATGSEGELLFWVPHLHRNSLQQSNGIKVIGQYETQLDFSSALLGDDWARCYTPN